MDVTSTGKTLRHKSTESFPHKSKKIIKNLFDNLNTDEPSWLTDVTAKVANENEAILQKFIVDVENQ